MVRWEPDATRLSTRLSYLKNVDMVYVSISRDFRDWCGRMYLFGGICYKLSKDSAGYVIVVPRTIAKVVRVCT